MTTTLASNHFNMVIITITIRDEVKTNTGIFGFYNRGEVISDQFDHFKVIGFRVSLVNSGEKLQKRDYLGVFP